MPQKLMDCSKPFMKMYTKPASLSRRRLESKGALKKPFLTKALVILKSVKRKIITSVYKKIYVHVPATDYWIILCVLPSVILGIRGFFSRATRSLVGRRPTRLRAKAEDKSGEATRKNPDHYLRLDRNRKPRMRSLWQLQYYYKNPR